LLSTQLNFCILALITVTATIFYLRKHTKITAPPTALLCALQMCQFTVSKLKPVNQAYISRCPLATNCADGTCFSTIETLPSSDMGHWFYHLSEPCQITSCCPNANRWTTHTETLSDTGVIQNVSKCTITINELQTLQELHGEIQSTIVITHFYVPDQIEIVADHEIPLIKQISPEEVTRLDDVKSSHGALTKFRCRFAFPH
jgi:hypothetical protein